MSTLGRLGNYFAVQVVDFEGAFCMLKCCPQCKRLAVEYDPYHRVEKCLNKECGWVNREKKDVEELSAVAFKTFRLSAVLEARNQKAVVPK